MYGQNPVVNDLVLTIINDGNGSQCGMTYAQRCEFKGGWVGYARACQKYNPTASPKDIAAAATIVLDYYREHVKEIKP